MLPKRQITPELELAVLLAGTADSRRAREPQGRQLLEVVDWLALESVLTRLGVLPLLGHRALALSGGSAPSWFQHAVEQSADACRNQNSLLELVTIQLLSSMRQAGIKAMPLKGPMLGLILYGEPGWRRSRDIDILVASEDLSHAVRVAKRLGYTTTPESLQLDNLPLLHLVLQHPQPQVPPIELHWRVTWSESNFSRDMLTRSVTTGQSGNRACLADEFVSLLLFYTRDGFVGVRLACDIAAWWDGYGGQMSLGAISDAINCYPGLERALLAAARAANQIVCLPIDGLLREEHPLERRVKLAVRLANPYAGGTAKQHHADAWLIDWLVTPPGGRAECIRRQLYAPALATGSAPRLVGPMAFTPVNRGLRLLRRFALSIARLGWEQLLGTRRLTRLGWRHLPSQTPGRVQDKR